MLPVEMIAGLISKFLFEHLSHVVERIVVGFLCSSFLLHVVFPAAVLEQTCSVQYLNLSPYGTIPPTEYILTCIIDGLFLGRLLRQHSIKGINISDMLLILIFSKHLMRLSISDRPPRPVTIPVSGSVIAACKTVGHSWDNVWSITLYLHNQLRTHLVLYRNKYP